MTVTAKITALLTGLTPAQLTTISRAERRRLSDQLERVNILIGRVEREVAASKPKTGVLARLGDGERAS